MALQIRRITDAEKRVFTSLEEARAAKPDRKNWRLYQLTGASGALSWTWAPDEDKAISWYAYAQKLCSALDLAKIPTKAAAAGILAALPAEDRSELLKEFAATNKKR
jgi:hypothetical protein